MTGRKCRAAACRVNHSDILFVAPPRHPHSPTPAPGRSAVLLYPCRLRKAFLLRAGEAGRGRGRGSGGRHMKETSRFQPILSRPAAPAADTDGDVEIGETAAGPASLGVQWVTILSTCHNTCAVCTLESLLSAPSDKPPPLTVTTCLIFPANSCGLPRPGTCSLRQGPAPTARCSPYPRIEEQTSDRAGESAAARPAIQTTHDQTFSLMDFAMAALLL